jgi:hypothetical protein
MSDHILTTGQDVYKYTAMLICRHQGRIIPCEGSVAGLPKVIRRDLIFSGCQGIIEKKLGIQLA